MSKKAIKKIVTLRLEGPVNLRKECYLIEIISNLRKQKMAAMAVMINSFGGSLRSARAISHALQKFRDQQQIPIYCFAEDYCLNSANLILTTGTKCFANKLSVLGDFGFVSNSLDSRQVEARLRIGRDQISTCKHKIQQGPFFTLNINDDNLRRNLVATSAKQLRDQIIKNRQTIIDLKYGNRDEFREKVFGENIIDPHDAVEKGFIDRVCNFRDLRMQQYGKHKLVEFGEKQFPNPYMNFLYEMIQRFKDERQQAKK